MPWNGSGTATRVHDWTTDDAADINILPDRMDEDSDDFVSMINNCMTKDGQNAATANLNIGGFKLTNVGNGTAATDAANLGQAQVQTANYAVSGGSSNAYTLTPSPAITSYVAGQTFKIKANHVNTGAATLNVSALGAKTIYKHVDAGASLFENLSAGDIKQDQVFQVVYDGTNFQLISPVYRTSGLGTCILASQIFS